MYERLFSFVIFFLQRKCGLSYGDRVKQISGSRKTRFNRHQDLKLPSTTTASGDTTTGLSEVTHDDRNQKFFKKMREQGSA